MSFSENETIIIIDLLEFTAKLCQTLANANRDKENEKTEREFTQRAIQAISLSDKFIEASDPDRGDGVFH